MSTTRIQDSGSGGKYLMLAFLCLTTLSTIGLAISTGMLDHKYRLLKNGYQTQSTALQQCLKDQEDPNVPPLPVLKCNSTYVIKGLYQIEQQEEEYIKYIKFGIPDLTEKEIQNYIDDIPGLLTASIEQYDDEITTSYNMLELYPDGSLIISAKDKNGQPITDITWGMPYTKTSINSTIPIVGNRGVVINKPINTIGNSVELNTIVSTGGTGISANSVSGSNYGISVTSDVTGEIYVGANVYGSVNISKNIINTGTTTSVLNVNGYIGGKGKDNAVVYLGGINASNRTGQALFIGNTTLGDGLSVKGSIEIEGSIISQLSQPTLKVQGFINNTMIGDIYTPERVYSSIDVGQVNSTNGYGIYVADGIDSYKNGIYINRLFNTNQVIISATYGQGIYVNGTISSRYLGIQVDGNILSSREYGIHVTGYVQGSGRKYAIVKLGGINAGINTSSNGTAQALFIGNTTLGDGLSVKGSIEIEGSIISQSNTQSALTIIGDISIPESTTGIYEIQLCSQQTISYNDNEICQPVSS